MSVCVEHNGGAGTEFIVRLGFAPGTVVDDEVAFAVAQWVGKACLQVLPYQEGVHGPWNIVWTSSVAGVDTPARFDVLVHCDHRWELPLGDAGFLFANSTSVQAEAIAAAVQSGVVPFPGGMPQVQRIGVSAVSTGVMARHWWQAIGGSTGWMVAPMLHKDMLNTTSENSSNFGWRNYPLSPHDAV